MTSTGRSMKVVATGEVRRLLGTGIMLSSMMICNEALYTDSATAIRLLIIIVSHMTYTMPGSLYTAVENTILLNLHRVLSSKVSPFYHGVCIMALWTLILSPVTSSISVASKESSSS